MCIYIYIYIHIHVYTHTRMLRNGAHRQALHDGGQRHGRARHLRRRGQTAKHNKHIQGNRNRQHRVETYNLHCCPILRLDNIL